MKTLKVIEEAGSMKAMFKYKKIVHESSLWIVVTGQIYFFFAAVRMPRIAL